MEIRPSEHEMKPESESVNQHKCTDSWVLPTADPSGVHNAGSLMAEDGAKNTGRMEQKSDSTMNDLPLEDTNVEDSQRGLNQAFAEFMFFFSKNPRKKAPLYNMTLSPQVSKWSIRYKS
ncbi:hypothetical protein TSTA_075720 [Talaromyces stipitatus ATCC 10500]|uniref:Uncharacterized protein n=1 Tax=Talaromyces stipitatus (strain ATCC 10500 / CBS 375.48 / QM 6759 / NRRL 1006) TaxID=441959 RepID=B8LVS0_TALSN|nr:uncharacterized protein TSTA_075720 [Talaromyces stipitatus ATCC 10500]EED24200.1 hypothetical protein TSTA_075720 [Talaromyces stipitatus ATCC 10500]